MKNHSQVLNLDSFFEIDTITEEPISQKEKLREYIVNNILDRNGNISSARMLSIFSKTNLEFDIIECTPNFTNLTMKDRIHSIINGDDIPKQCPLCSNFMSYILNSCSVKCGSILSRPKYQSTLMNRYGINCGCLMLDETGNKKRIKTYRKNNDGKSHGVSNESIRKSKQTRLQRYGCEDFFNMESYKETCLRRYGVENVSQVPEIHERQQGYKNWKDYTLPSGIVIKLQGYEWKALDELFVTYSEEEIILSRKDIPEIWYFTCPDNKRHRYFPDMWVPKENLIIEVKSEYTMKKDYDINKLKEQAVLDAGYNFKYLIYTKFTNISIV